MPKPIAQAIDAAHIDAYLASNSDFVFEVGVLKQVRELGLTARHGGTYEDPVTGKTRQFDIQAETVPTDHTDLVRFRFAIECKNLQRSFPLVVHRLPRDASEAYLDVVFSHEPTDILYSRSKRVRLTGDDSPYGVAEEVGKALDQIGRSSAGDVFSNDQDVFDKITQALNSAQPLLEHSHYAASKDTLVFSIVVPVVVVPRETLWCVDYDDAGNVTVGPHVVDQTSLFVGKEWMAGGKLGTSFWLSHIEIVTPEVLPRFVAGWREHLGLTSERLWNIYSAQEAKRRT